MLSYRGDRPLWMLVWSVLKAWLPRQVWSRRRRREKKTERERTKGDVKNGSLSRLPPRPVHERKGRENGSGGSGQRGGQQPDGVCIQDLGLTVSLYARPGGVDAEALRRRGVWLRCPASASASDITALNINDHGQTGTRRPEKTPWLTRRSSCRRSPTSTRSCSPVRSLSRSLLLPSCAYSINDLLRRPRGQHRGAPEARVATAGEQERSKGSSLKNPFL